MHMVLEDLAIKVCGIIQNNEKLMGFGFMAHGYQKRWACFDFFFFFFLIQASHYKWIRSICVCEFSRSYIRNLKRKTTN